MSLGPSLDSPTVETGPAPAPDPEDDDADLPPTPEDIQVNPANLDEFDRTYLARREQWRLTGDRPSPAPFPLQVLPRMAFTINYNFVFDDEEGEWVPQNPFSGGGGRRTVVDNGTITVPSEGSDFVLLNIGGQGLGGDTLLATVGGVDGGSGGIVFANSTQVPDAGGELFYNLQFEPGPGWILNFQNGETSDVEVAWIVERISPT